MPFHIDQVHSDITVLDGELPLTQMQVEKLVSLVSRRLEAKGRDQALANEASSIQRHNTRPLLIG